MGAFLCLAVLSVSAQQTLTPEHITVNPPVVVNFQHLADYERANPPQLVRHYIEQGEDREQDYKFNPGPIPADAKVFNIPASVRDNGQGGEKASVTSPSTTISFNGVMDNGTLIPPDIRGAVGPTYVLETTNQQFNIYTKTGTLNSTVTITTFFSATGGSGYFDPHCMYDANNGRYIICMDGNYSNGDGGIFVAISQTNDPTGSWYVYSFDGIGNKTDFLDYPLLGFNNNWVVVTGNDFIGGSSPVYAKVYVMDRASLYSGSLGTVSTFTNTNGFCIDPAQTYDATQNTEYLVMDYNGNSGGNGYVQIGTITGTPTAPVYTAGNTLGVNQPWSETSVNAKQQGNSNALEDGDTRIGNAIYTNGSLWFTHTAFLPASSPTYSGVDWWQVDPSALTVTQFGRVSDPAGQIFYYYPSIQVNGNGDAFLGYCLSSSTMYSSAGYAFHASSDAVNTMETGVTYKSGVAGYYKTYGGGRNRWGDFSGTAVDPTDNSFWNFSEWANTSNNWGTVIGRVPASSSCGAPGGESTASVTNNSATFNWNAVTGSTTYNIQYRVVGTTTWSTGISNTNSYSVSGLTAGTAYEWQVQSVCAAGNSSFTSSTDFTTASNCTTPTGMSTTAVTATTATFNWASESGAGSYNIQYRVVGTTTWSTATSGTTSYYASGLSGSSNYEWQVQAVCTAGGTSAFTASTDFSTPVVCGAVSGLTAGSLANTSAALSWTAVSGATSYNLQWKLSSGSTFTLVSGLTTNSYNLTGLTSCSAYQFEVQSVCPAGSSAYSGTTGFTTTGCSISYCTSTATTTTYEYIKNVKLGSINQTSTDGPGYVNYTAVSTNLAGGSANTITLTPGYTGSSYTEDFTVYIDYNHNGVFTDAGETVVKVSGRSAVSKSFTVPTTALNGTTRMRIQMQYGSYETNPCATFTYGEVQDFTVNITGNAHGDVTSPVAEEVTPVDPIDAIDQIRLYPNPAHDNVTIEFYGNQLGSGKIAVYSLSGQRIFTGETTVNFGINTYNLTTNTLSDGLYIMEIESNGCIKRERFIVAK